MILEKETYESLGRTFDNASQKHKIWCCCDYCGKSFQRLKHNIARSWRVIKTDACSDIICVQKKRVESNNVLFGTDNAFQNEKVKDKIRATNIERFGVDNPLKLKEFQDKQKQTCKERYGAENVFQSPIIKQRIKETIQARYGVDNPFQLEEFQKKQRETLTKKYGVSHALQNADFRKKAMDTCIEHHGCFPANNYGKAQSDLKDWLNSLGFDFKSNRTLIPGQEIDLYDEKQKFAIEYCGLYWHNELSPEPRKRRYHLDKYRKCLKQDVQLLTIFSDEWLTREKQCKSHIKSLLGVLDIKIHGRKCIVKEINKNEGRSFIEEYHIQGQNKLGIVFFGLYYNEELVGVISLGRHNRQYDRLVLDRLCFKDGVQVIGGASKLFSRCVEWARSRGRSEIVSFSDNRWSIGKVYKALGFKLEDESGPDYSYVDMKNTDERLTKQSQKKQNTNCPENLTESQWTNQRGLAKIWDCGKKRWVFDLKGMKK